MTRNDWLALAAVGAYASALLLALVGPTVWAWLADLWDTARERRAWLDHWRGVWEVSNG